MCRSREDNYLRLIELLKYRSTYLDSEKKMSKENDTAGDDLNPGLKVSITDAFGMLKGIIQTLDCTAEARYNDELKDIYDRYYDPEFSLALIGNFSCGKSTFLNALIGQELLAVSDLPTTAIPTYIRWNKEDMIAEFSSRTELRSFDHGNQPIIKVVLENGKDYWLAGREEEILEKLSGVTFPKEVGPKIDFITTTNTLIGKIKRVEISFPRKKQFENFCLIDTPGVNPGEETNIGHIVQTQAVLREEADAAVILYTAKDAMSKDTKQFMEENASHLIKNAIILLTKWDLVPERQKEKLLKNTARLVKEQFHQEAPQIYSISAGRALEYAANIDRSDDCQEWADHFDQTIDTIMNELHTRREEIVSERVIALMKKLIEEISKSIEKDTNALSEEKEILDKVSLVNLQKDFDGICKKYEKTLHMGANSRSAKAAQIVRNQISSKSKAICGKIDEATNQKQLNWCIKDYYNESMEGIDQVIIQQINSEIIPEINKLNLDYVKEVEACLEDYQRYLGEIGSHSISVKTEAISGTVLAKSYSSTSFVEQHAALLIAGGIAMMVPGLNLFVLAAGFLWDAGRFNRRKEEAKTDVQSKLKAFEDRMVESCKTSLNQSEEQNIKWSKKVLKKYKAKYKSALDQIESSFEERSTYVNDRILKNKAHINTMMNIRESLSVE